MSMSQTFGQRTTSPGSDGELFQQLVVVVDDRARRGGQGGAQLGEPHALVDAQYGSEVREPGEDPLHQPVDVPALGSIVELVAVRGCHPLPDGLLDRGEGASPPASRIALSRNGTPASRSST